MGNKKGIIFAGAVIGFLSALLVWFGNPGNMGVCVACFIRDTAGAIGLHSVEKLSYIRPEILGIVLGAFIMAIIGKEFSTKGGSSPFIRFVLGFVVMVGALVFLGCPLRMVLRLGGGDLNAIVGLIGFAAGIFGGIIFLNKGFSLKRTYKLNKSEGYLFPIICVGLALLVIIAPAFVTLKAKHAPLYISLGVGAIAGILAQRTRLCMVGGIRDLILFKDGYLISGFISILVFVLIGNAVFGNLNIGFVGQPAAHNDGLWNFLGMFVAGWGSVLLGGCPLRQLVLSGEGNIDSVVTLMGMLLGGALSHNFALASSGAGPSANGKVAVIIGIFILLGISYFNIQKVKVKMKGDAKVDSSRC
ncbi:YedE family putative selenium transporter [Oceanirhabdus sp. W0125-5]|uniref:YedE family putative selenium transporter n=1 Tax=Oceanirhabdus sp. W0125-5 TaxID=2999116 RepID=UPI0022F2D236|nr:YedE family putative selenium transporter [Oceanirhabdus sp. W0125-5]WBW95705.1 YedE family putative selenium transporter [Oceanirhabdus sp. W0125-5]